MKLCNLFHAQFSIVVKSYSGNSGMVSSSHSNPAIPLLQSIEKSGPKEYFQHSNRALNSSTQSNTEAFKISLSNLGVKPWTHDEQTPNMLANIDHLRSFYDGQEHNGSARPSLSSLEILCQIFPGRSRSSLESILKVLRLMK